MSASNIISPANNKIFDRYLPNPYPFPAQANDLASVLVAGNQAGDQDIVGLNQLEVRKIVQQQPLLGESLTIGEAGGDLRIFGATTKGSILAGNGTSTIEVPVGTTGYVLKSNPATVSGLEWAVDISGVTGVVGVNAGTNIDITGTVSQPIVGLSSPLTSTLGMGTVALTDKIGASGTVGQFLSAGTGGETLWATPPDTLPTLTAGTNIDITGTQANPTIALATPTTSDIQIGVGTAIIAKDNYGTPLYTMSIDATGLNDTYSVGGVENKEDIAVSATNVIDTISTTNTTDYYNSSVLICDANYVNDTKTSQILTAGIEKTASLSIYCNTSGSLPTAGVGCGVSAPTTSPFPDIIANVGMSCDTNNPVFSLSQSAPFAPSYNTTFDKDGIIQNNSTGTGFNLQSAQNISLTCPIGQVINVPNGNNISLTSGNYTSDYRQDGVHISEFLAGNYTGNADLFTSGGSSQMFVAGGNLATANTQYVRIETPFGGDASIEHSVIGTSRNLGISSTGNMTLSADNIDLDATGRLVCPSLASGNYLDYNTGKLTIVNNSVAGSANPLLVLQNNNNTAGATTFETYKNDAPTSTGGDTIASWSATCNTNVGKTETSRVNHIAYGVGASNNDGGIALACKVNSAISNFIVCNGGSGTGEVQVFKPITTTSPNNLDINCPTAGGAVNITSASNVNITATGDNMTLISGGAMTLATTGTGANIEFKPETSAGAIIFTGSALQSNTSSGNSGEHLVITLNGTQYKIKLETP